MTGKRQAERITDSTLHSPGDVVNGDTLRDGMGRAGFGWKDNGFFFSLLEFECLRDIYKEVYDLEANQKIRAEAWVKNSRLESSFGIHLLESEKEMRLH